MAGLEDYQTFDEPPAAPPPPPARTPIVGGRPQITVHPAPKEKGGIENYEPFDSGDQAAAPSTAPYREVSPGQAAVHGYVDLATFGLAPGIAGAAAAGEAPGGTGTAQAMQGVASENPGAEAIGEGISRLWNDHFGNHPDPAAREAFQKGRNAVAGDRDLAKEQHLFPYIAGQLGAALTLPAGRLAMGKLFGEIAPALGSVMPGLSTMERAMLTGGAQTAAYEAGTALSEGRPEDIREEAGKGFVTGGALGVGGAAVLGGLGALGGKLAQIRRGARQPEVEAGRQVVQALGADINRFGPSMTPEEQAVAHAANIPMAVVDVGGEQTRKLFRASANLSPEGRQAAETFTKQRFRGQGERGIEFVHDLMGGADKTRDQEVIQAAKLAFNKPAYQRAYAAGDRPIWSPEIERLVGDPSMMEAIGKATKTGKSWAIFDGLGGFNPGVTVTEDGRLIFNKGPTGVPTYPNIQFWDYVQRELKGALDETKNSADRTRLGNLRRELLKDLDAQVPEFAQARQTAANFFGAENAVEAGEKFVMMKGRDLAPARRALESMKPVERELFARAFASDLASKFGDIRNNTDVINQAFVDSPTARAKIDLALGREKANQLEAYLRAENIVDKARQALGGPTTARQQHEMGSAGGAVGALEAVRHAGGLPGVIMGMVGIKGAANKMHGIDEKVAQKVLEMLVSKDQSQVLKAIQVMSKSPTWMNFLRTVTGAGTRVGAARIGIANLAAGAMVGAEDLAGMFKAHEDEGGKYPIPKHETENKQYHQYEDVTQ